MIRCVAGAASLQNRHSGQSKPIFSCIREANVARAVENLFFFADSFLTAAVAATKPALAAEVMLLHYLQCASSPEHFARAN